MLKYLGKFIHRAKQRVTQYLSRQKNTQYQSRPKSYSKIAWSYRHKGKATVATQLMLSLGA